MRIKFFSVLIITTILLSGCSISFLDPYKKPKYGEMAVSSWFKDKELGKLRKKAENIDEIVKTECEYLESRGNKYVFSCAITVKEQGETVIPLSKHVIKNVYAVFIRENNNKYSSKVYNSKYTKENRRAWEEDKYLNY